MDIKTLTPVERELVKQGLDAMVSKYAGLSADAAVEGKKDLSLSHRDTGHIARRLRDRVRAIQWGSHSKRKGGTDVKQTLGHWLAHQDRAEIVIRKDGDCLTAHVERGTYVGAVVLDCSIVVGDADDDHEAMDVADAIIGVLDDIVDAIDDIG